MIDIEKILDDYRQSTVVRESISDTSLFVTVPFYHSKSDESIAIRITEHEDGRPILSDCHTTIDYLEERDVDLEDYQEKLDKIMQRFGLIQDGNVFRMTIPTTDPVYVKLYLGYFIQAISIIANIDL